MEAYTVDVDELVVAAGALDVDEAGCVAVLEVEAAVVDEGEVGGENDVEFVVDVELVGVRAAFALAELVALSMLHSAMPMRAAPSTATPSLCRR
jgi:hypothetical protein